MPTLSPYRFGTYSLSALSTGRFGQDSPVWRTQYIDVKRHQWRIFDKQGDHPREIGMIPAEIRTSEDTSDKVGIEFGLNIIEGTGDDFR